MNDSLLCLSHAYSLLITFTGEVLYKLAAALLLNILGMISITCLQGDLNNSTYDQ